MSVWDRRKEILYGDGSVGEINRNNPAYSSVWGQWHWVLYMMVDLVFFIVNQFGTLTWFSISPSIKVFNDVQPGIYILSKIATLVCVHLEFFCWWCNWNWTIWLCLRNPSSFLLTSLTSSITLPSFWVLLGHPKLSNFISNSLSLASLAISTLGSSLVCRILYLSLTLTTPFHQLSHNLIIYFGFNFHPRFNLSDPYHFLCPCTNVPVSQWNAIFLALHWLWHVLITPPINL